MSEMTELFSMLKIYDDNPQQETKIEIDSRLAKSEVRINVLYIVNLFEMVNS